MLFNFKDFLKTQLPHILLYNADLFSLFKTIALNKFILDIENENYLSSLKIVETIKFKDTIPLLSDLNSVIFIYNSMSREKNINNTTKKIIITNKSKTRRK